MLPMSLVDDEMEKLFEKPTYHWSLVAEFPNSAFSQMNLLQDAPPN